MGVASLNRRKFLHASAAVTGLGLSVLTGCGPLPPWSNSNGKIKRIGSLAQISAPPTGMPPDFDIFLQDLRELGWVEGQNVTFEYRWANEVNARLPDLAADLVQAGVDLIMTWTTPEADAARRATTTIPIVTGGADFVLQGFAESLARPGGNITGVSTLDIELNGKRLELLKEAVPTIRRVAALKVEPSGAPIMAEAHDKALEAGARTAGVEVVYTGVSAASQLDGAISRVMAQRPDAFFSMPSGLLWTMRNEIAELALKHRLPSVGPGGQYSEAGMLLSYGSNGRDLRRRLAPYVDRILRGANPAEMPILRPSVFDFGINLKTARALGLTIPQLMLQQATDVVQ